MTVTSPITIILADDHTLLREGLRLIIEQHHSFKVVAEASDGIEAIALVQLHQPKVLICDISMPNLSGIEVARTLTSLHVPTHLLFLTIMDGEEYLLEAIRAGVKGFLPKRTASQELIEAIARVAAGQEYYSKLLHEKAFSALRKLSQPPEIRLTAREQEILQLLAEGLSTRMVAHQLSLSEYTITNHRTNLLRKLSAGNVAELIRKAVSLGLVK